ncbi:hypothetical protein SAMN04487936_10596 [Halobacillus dabanensis]|uniref:DUF4367 domain-containing protein n=1 Tax=Halobacillus dabanensis TaxID=240302 RepID=A0A1I3V2M2_HALDA|nr:hypothetical protein [Halobacillus dabanensis]SFJ89163.1 hypothetical protein SAMN04487936_10596 [Halobacillus dabanensis]
MERKLKKVAKSSYLNDLSLSHEKKGDMLRKVKSTATNKYEHRWRKPFAGSLACIALLFVLIMGGFNMGSLTNPSKSLEQLEDTRYKQPLSIAKQVLPDDLILPTPFYGLIKEPIVKYDRLDERMVNLDTVFEGENFYMTLRVHKEENLFNKNANAFEETKYKKKVYLQKEEGKQMLLIHGQDGETLTYEYNGYFYRVALYEKEWKNNKQYILHPATKKYLDKLRSHLY